MEYCVRITANTGSKYIEYIRESSALKFETVPWNACIDKMSIGNVMRIFGKRGFEK